MNKLILFALYAAVFLISPNIWSSEVRVDGRAKTLFYVPMPTLHIVDYDLEDEGAVVHIFLDYQTEVVHAQYDALVAQYPGYTINRMTTQPSGDFFVQIPSLELKSEAVVKMNPMGVIWSAELNLNKRQYRKFIDELSGQPLSSMISVNAPVAIEYNYSVVLEEYVAPERLCQEMQGFSTLSEVVLGLHRMRKPRDMRYESTLVDLKTAILHRCFKLKPQNKIIGTLEALLASEVLVQSLPQKISAFTVQIENKHEEIQLPYIIQRR